MCCFQYRQEAPWALHPRAQEGKRDWREQPDMGVFSSGRRLGGVSCPLASPLQHRAAGAGGSRGRVSVSEDLITSALSDPACPLQVWDILGGPHPLTHRPWVRQGRASGWDPRIWRSTSDLRQEHSTASGESHVLGRWGIGLDRPTAWHIPFPCQALQV